MKAFDIKHTWKHVQGHTVVDKINNKIGTIFAEDSDNAIEMFKNLSPLLGQYIKKDSDGDWRYGNYDDFLKFGDKTHIIKAVELKQTYMLLIIFTVCVLAIYFHFEPQLDKLKTGEWIIWYNSDRNRKIRKYFKIKNYGKH